MVAVNVNSFAREEVFRIFRFPSPLSPLRTHDPVTLHGLFPVLFAQTGNVRLGVVRCREMRHIENSLLHDCHKKPRPRVPDAPLVIVPLVGLLGNFPANVGL